MVHGNKIAYFFAKLYGKNTTIWQIFRFVCASSLGQLQNMVLEKNMFLSVSKLCKSAMSHIHLVYQRSLPVPNFGHSRVASHLQL